ncbi:type ISP restriction/modification enzyme [Candidatus Nitrosacidococcus tergens]|uniref:Type ISP restriction-modification enzyme LLaBIII C-terminal specificity domain-containing protein n=1 Tax=Candidatus Nitrosacidococcus tergens TaxID=553981 RepID=A0A7G1Q9M2_9GAMM|nr:type ISP restriction/modification enzyme [Candidatus Nitrosacidococcus tergens]CAB1276099.1 protein of unknown function [Candidatus Nitrosacidococcus tergens]
MSLKGIIKNKIALVIFNNSSLGVGTNRDAWVYQSSKDKLARNITATIGFYNQERERFHQGFSNLTKQEQEKKIN